MNTQGFLCGRFYAPYVNFQTSKGKGLNWCLRSYRIQIWKDESFSYSKLINTVLFGKIIVLSRTSFCRVIYAACFLTRRWHCRLQDFVTKNYSSIECRHTRRHSSSSSSFKYQVTQFSGTLQWLIWAFFPQSDTLFVVVFFVCFLTQFFVHHRLK